jgi:bifunctional non-homologous end joining protein LigD
MTREGFDTWPKLTGGKGIHLVAPLDVALPHDDARRIARNGRGTTAIGAWSPRAREGFPIAAPVTWSQIEAGTGPDAFTMQSPFRRARQTRLR